MSPDWCKWRDVPSSKYSVAYTSRLKLLQDGTQRLRHQAQKNSKISLLLWMGFWFPPILPFLFLLPITHFLLIIFIHTCLPFFIILIHTFLALLIILMYTFLLCRYIFYRSSSWIESLPSLDSSHMINKINVQKVTPDQCTSERSPFCQHKVAGQKTSCPIFYMQIVWNKGNHSNHETGQRL